MEWLCFSQLVENFLLSWKHLPWPDWANISVYEFFTSTQHCAIKHCYGLLIRTIIVNDLIYTVLLASRGQPSVLAISPMVSVMIFNPVPCESLGWCRMFWRALTHALMRRRDSFWFPALWLVCVKHSDSENKQNACIRPLLKKWWGARENRWRAFTLHSACMRNAFDIWLLMCSWHLFGPHVEEQV